MVLRRPANANTQDVAACRRSFIVRPLVVSKKLVKTAICSTSAISQEGFSNLVVWCTYPVSDRVLVLNEPCCFVKAFSQLTQTLVVADLSII